MSTVRVFAVENKLAELVRQPGGKTAEAAVKAAEIKVEAQRDVSLAALIGKADQMAALAADGRASGDPEAFGRIYDLSNAIYGLAGAFGLKGLADAAFSLCDLADSYRGGEAANWPAVDVHVDGVRLLANLGEKADAATTDTILDGLRQVRARVLPPA